MSQVAEEWPLPHRELVQLDQSPTKILSDLLNQ